MKQHILQTGSSNVGLKLLASILSCTNNKLFGNREVLFDPSSLLTVVWGCKTLYHKMYYQCTVVFLVMKTFGLHNFITDSEPSEQDVFY